MLISQLNRGLAKQDPASAFASPLGIVTETLLTRGEKLATLDRWRRSILEQLVDQGELKRASLLSEIEEARTRLTRIGA